MTDPQGSRAREPLRELQREVKRVLESFEPLQGLVGGRSFLALDLQDAGDRFIVSLEVPGMQPADIDLTLVGEELRIRGERKPPAGVAPENYRLQERRLGAWERSVVIPQPIETSGVIADYANGVLSVVLPKAEAAKPRRIDVAVSGS